jgi:cobalt-zinc-cadmium efflux system protein
MAHEHRVDRHPELRGSSRKRLAVVFGLTLGFLVVEVLGALASNSLALLADASHMLSDAAAVALALGALQYAGRPATPARTYGFARAEILAALLNALLLILIVGFVVWQAWTRLWNPPEVHSLPLLLVAVAGLAVNLLNARILSGGRRHSLNEEGAYLHVLSDALGSVGAVVAGAVIALTGANVVDPIVSVLIGGIILWSAWDLLRRAVAVLMEGTPPGIDLARVHRSMLDVDGVAAVHDLHIWTLTSGFVAMSAHVTAREGAGPRVLSQLRDRLHDDYGISHTTLQIETAAQAQAEEVCVADPRCLPPPAHEAIEPNGRHDDALEAGAAPEPSQRAR